MAYVAPAVFVLVLVGLLPFLWSIWVSFLNLAGSTRSGDFVGLANYQKLLSDTKLWAALGRTFLIMAVALPVQLVLGMLLALHFQAERPGKKLFVALLALPAVISPMVAGSMWRLMFDHRFGPVNQMISAFTEKPVVLLWVVKGSLPFWSIVVAEVWQWTPFMFIILLAAIANVDRDQMQAAALDGAHRRHVFWYVVLPAIRPVLIIAVLIRALDLFRLFDVVWQLTKGGPGNRTETISVYMYIQGFQGFQTSYVAAIVVVLAIVLSSVLMLALRRVRLDR
ncbi:MAG: sugar ABC transporter permease [Geminicoccaceae bacterium]|nr:sugar ABC transporter permease [Geminicoccaceae bacterium]